MSIEKFNAKAEELKDSIMNLYAGDTSYADDMNLIAGICKMIDDLCMEYADTEKLYEAYYRRDLITLGMAANSKEKEE